MQTFTTSGPVNMHGLYLDPMTVQLILHLYLLFKIRQCQVKRLIISWIRERN